MLLCIKMELRRDSIIVERNKSVRPIARHVCVNIDTVGSTFLGVFLRHVGLRFLHSQFLMLRLAALVHWVSVQTTGALRGWVYANASQTTRIVHRRWLCIDTQHTGSLPDSSPDSTVVFGITR